ncbi:MAG: methyl-accepting chemotaxis protein [Candidatus Sericytochromatia bacterium]
MNTDSSFFKRLSIGLKLALIPLIFIFALGVMIFYVVSIQQQQRDYAQVVSIVARQRTLNQWYTKDLLMAALKQPNDYAYFRETFRESAEALKNGGMVIANLRENDRVFVPAAPNADIRESIDSQKRVMDKLAALEPMILNTRPGTPAYDAMYRQVDALNGEVHATGRRTVELYTLYTQEESDRVIRDVVLLGLIVGFLGLFLNSLISRSISHPVTRLAQRAQLVSQGELGGDMLHVTAMDEVGQLTQAFNKMLASLREMTQQNIESAKELSTSTAEILASTQQQSASTQEQVAALQETTATMEEVRQSGAQISERARQVASEAEVAMNMTDAGLKSVQQTVGAMHNIRGQINEVAENIVSLSEKNRAVGDIVALVTHIAEQTNLLALNAAIEAAAAGEQGRSFAVVANEMKHLADQAKDATQQVRKMLEDIQKGITKAVMLTEEAVKKVEGGRQQTDISENTIRNMAETTQQSIQAFQQIVAATNQQQLGLEQIFQALQDIRQSTEQTAVSTVQLTRASNGLNAMSQQLQRLVMRYTL